MQYDVCEQYLLSIEKFREKTKVAENVLKTSGKITMVINIKEQANKAKQAFPRIWTLCFKTPCSNYSHFFHPRILLIHSDTQSILSID